MEQLLIPPIQREENQELLAQLVAHYENSLGRRREQAGYLIDWFVEGLQSGRQHIVRRTIEETRQQLAWLEEYQDSEEELLFDGELKRLDGADLNLPSDYDIEYHEDGGEEDE